MADDRAVTLRFSFSDNSQQSVAFTVPGGKDGANGKDGNDGANGRDGKDGTNGRDGRNGLNGLNGKDGKDSVLFHTFTVGFNYPLAGALPGVDPDTPSANKRGKGAYWRFLLPVSDMSIPSGSTDIINLSVAAALFPTRPCSSDGTPINFTNYISSLVKLNEQNYLELVFTFDQVPTHFYYHSASQGYERFDVYSLLRPINGTAFDSDIPLNANGKVTLSCHVVIAYEPI